MLDEAIAKDIAGRKKKGYVVERKGDKSLTMIKKWLKNDLNASINTKIKKVSRIIKFFILI